MAQNKVTYQISADAKQLKDALDAIKGEARAVRDQLKALSKERTQSVTAQIREERQRLRIEANRIRALELQNKEQRALLTQSRLATSQENERVRAIQRQNAELKRQLREKRELDKINQNLAAMERKRYLQSLSSPQISRPFLPASQYGIGGTIRQSKLREQEVKRQLGSRGRSSGVDPLEGLDIAGRTKSRLDALVGRTNNLTSANKRLKTSIDGVGKGLSSVYGAGDGGRIFGGIAGRIIDITSALALFNTIRGISSAIVSARDFVIETNQGIEDARIGIASTITAAGQYVDTLGNALPVARQIALALGEADAIIPRLLKLSSERGLNFEALLQTQTATAGFTKAAGFTPEQTVETIASVAFFSEKLGISQGRIVRTLDNIIKGYRVSQTELGTSLGLNDQIIESMRSQGRLAEGLLELLNGTAEASKKNLDTLSGIKNALDANLRILSSTVGAEFFALVKESYQILLDGIRELNNSPEKVQNLSDLMKIAGEAMTAGASAMVAAANAIGSVDWRKVNPPESRGLGESIMEFLLPSPATLLSDPEVSKMLSGLGANRRFNEYGEAFAAGIMSVQPDFSGPIPGTGVMSLNELAAARASSNVENFFGEGTVLAPPEFIRRNLDGEEAVNGGRRRAGGSRATARQITRKEAFASALAEERRIREQSLEEDLRFLGRGRNEISAIQGQIRRVEQELPRVGDDEFVELQNRLVDLQEELNAKKQEQLQKEREIAEEALRQLKTQRESADIVGGLIKGLRDGNSITDLLTSIGRDAGDKMIDALTEKFIGPGGGVGGNISTLFEAVGTIAGGGGLALQGGQIVKTLPAGQAGPPAPLGAGGGGLGAGLGSTAAGLGSIASGAATGAGFASLGGLFGASAQEQKIASIGGAGGGAIGAGIGFAIAGPVGAAIGSALGGIAGTIGGFFAEALGIVKGPSTDRVIRKRLGEAISSSGLPSLRGKPGEALAGVAGASAIARFLTLDESGREIKLGRGGFNPQQSRDDVLAAIGVSTTGLSERDKEAALSRVLGTASGGLASGLGLLSSRRTERLTNIEQRSRRAATVGEFYKNLGYQVQGGKIKIGNEMVPIGDTAIERYRTEAIAATNATFQAEVADFIDAIDEIPKAVDGAALAFAALGTNGVANMEALRDSIEDAASVLETGFTGAIKSLAEGNSLRSAVEILDQAYQDVLTERTAERFLETQKLDPNFSLAVDYGNKAIDAALAGDFVSSAEYTRLSNEYRSKANITGAQSLASLTPTLRGLNTGTIGVGGVNLPPFDTPSRTVIPGPIGAPFPALMHGGEIVRSPIQEDRILRSNNEMMGVLGEIASLLRSGRNVSVYSQTGSTDVRISSREISDAEKNARKRQSSGDRKPKSNVGVRL